MPQDDYRRGYRQGQLDLELHLLRKLEASKTPKEAKELRLVLKTFREILHPNHDNNKSAVG